MAKTQNTENWGRSKAKQRYADGGEVTQEQRQAGLGLLKEKMTEDQKASGRNYSEGMKKSYRDTMNVSQAIRREGE